MTETTPLVPTDLRRWRNENALDPAWVARSVIAAQYVPAGAHVLDIGCGAMTLERHLPPGCTYLPCDVVARDDRTTICDLNLQPIPQAVLETSDFVTLLGVLEYLTQPADALRQLARAGKTLLMSYCVADWTKALDRPSHGWINNLTLDNLIALSSDAGYSVRRAERIDEYQVLLLLAPRSPALPAPKRVLVLSYANVGNFGDRLGVQLLQSILPPHAVVTYAYFKPWKIPQGHFDLLILGIGNSLFGQLLTPDLLALLDRVPHKIGIFGTQYRDGFSAAQLHAVIDRLDAWHARYLEDTLLYGQGRGNVHHLGDWLINAFPLTEGRVTQLLTIGDEVLQHRPLDRMIAHIQQHQKVLSTRLHPLLCALCSAEIVAYREQREENGVASSGKFRSMLVDVFGRSFPEGAFWRVDKATVLAYKIMVSGNMQRLQKQIEEILG